MEICPEYNLRLSSITTIRSRLVRPRLLEINTTHGIVINTTYTAIISNLYLLRSVDELILLLMLYCSSNGDVRRIDNIHKITTIPGEGENSGRIIVVNGLTHIDVIRATIVENPAIAIIIIYSQLFNIHRSKTVYVLFDMILYA